MNKYIATTLALALGLTTLLAEDAPPKSLWETSAGFGVTLTKGNKDSFLGTVTLDSKRKWAKDEIAFGITAGYGETEVTIPGTPPASDTTDDETTAEYVRGFSQYNHLFTERTFGGLRLDGEYDDVSGVNYRFRISPLVGYYFIKSEKTLLAGEVGPSFVFEELEGKDAEQYTALRVGERFEHKFSKTARFWQSAEYLPDISDWQEKYLINAEIGVDAALTEKLSLSVMLQNSYDSQPSPGRDSNDLRLISGLKYRF